EFPIRACREATVARPPRWSTPRTPARSARRRSARCGAHVRDARSSRLLEILADHVEEPLPPRALSLDPRGRIGKRLRLEAQPVGAPFNHPRHHAGLLEQPQMAGDRRLGDSKIPTRLANGDRPATEPLHDLAS